MGSVSYEQNALEKLVADITAQTKTITEILKKKGASPPSFEVGDATGGMPLGPEFKELQEARMALIDASSALQHLAIGPEDWIKWQSLTVSSYLILWKLPCVSFS